MDLQPGQTLDRYELSGLLGEGGAARVYRATHAQLGTQHALKVLHLVGAGVRERMLREARVQAQLRHPNLVPVSDVFFVGQQPVIVMDFVDGPNLEGWINTARPDPSQAEAVFRGILAGVAYAHGQGVVHRDLKPANILVETQAGRAVPRVTDFGLARVLEDSSPRRTRMGVAMGTPGYMAPEMLSAAPTADERADVFSLGCILYALVCHRIPFAAADRFELFEQLRKGDYTDPSEHRPDLGQGVLAAIRGCLIVDRDQRIPTCDALLEVLDLKRGWTAAGPTWSRPPGWQTMVLEPDHEATQMLRAPVLGDSEDTDLTRDLEISEEQPAPLEEPAEVPRVRPPPPPPGIQTLPPSQPTDVPVERADNPYSEPAPRAPQSRTLAWVVAGVFAVLLLVGCCGGVFAAMLPMTG